MEFLNATLYQPLHNATNHTCHPSVTGEVSVATKVAKTTTYAMLMLVSLLGNSLAITVVSRTREMWTTTNTLIANMAASDLLMSLVAVPRLIVEIVESQRWLIQGTFGLILCKLVYFFQDISTAVSIQSLVVISVDRFSAIVFPFRAPFITFKTCRVIIPVMWLTACALHSVYFYIFKLVNRDDTTHCTFTWEPAFNNKKAQETYYIVLLVLLIILPLLIIAITHCAMIVQLRKLKSSGTDSCWSSRHRQREDATAMKKIVYVMLVFLICIIPINVCAILFYFVWDWKAPCGVDMELVFYVARFIFFSNASINPCLYFLLYRRYRQGLRDIFKRVCQVRRKRKCRMENRQRHFQETSF